MAARSTPQSSINNILDFLMFFNSGNTCPVTHDFISNKIGGASEQVNRRYNDFYIVSAFIKSQVDWDQSSLGDLLSQMDDLEKNYTHIAGLKHKWFVTKLDIIFQIGLSVLREIISLESDALPEDPAEFSIPNMISVAAYRNKIEALLEKHKSYYIEDETGDLHVKYPHHIESLVTGVIDEECANTKSKRGAKKAVLNGRKVYELLEEHRINVFTQSIIKFIQSVEEKALPIPLDVGCYAGGAGEPLSSTLRRLSHHHQRDWTDAEAQAHGPYAQQGESSARKQHSGMAVADNEAPVAATSSTRSKTAASATKQAPSSPVFAQSAPTSPAQAAPVAKRGKKSASAKNKNVEVEEESADAETNAVTVVAQKFKRKYEESDPLLELMGDATSPVKARARVSREAELPPSTSKQQSSSAKKPTTGAAASSKANAASSALGKKKLLEGGALKKGEKVNFSDSEELESVYEEESEVDSDEGRSASGAVAQLLSLKRSHPKVNGKFPAKLDSPAKSAKNAKNKKGTISKVNKVALAAQSNAIIAAGQRQKWNFEQETILAEAVERYGEGNWQGILHDPEYAVVFVGRTNVNLKDKWRNMQKAALK